MKISKKGRPQKYVDVICNNKKCEKYKQRLEKNEKCKSCGSYWKLRKARCEKCKSKHAPHPSVCSAERKKNSSTSSNSQVHENYKGRPILPKVEQMSTPPTTRRDVPPLPPQQNPLILQQQNRVTNTSLVNGGHHMGSHNTIPICNTQTFNNTGITNVNQPLYFYATQMWIPFTYILQQNPQFPQQNSQIPQQQNQVGCILFANRVPHLASNTNDCSGTKTFNTRITGATQNLNLNVGQMCIQTPTTGNENLCNTPFDPQQQYQVGLTGGSHMENNVDSNTSPLSGTQTLNTETTQLDPNFNENGEMWNSFMDSPISSSFDEVSKEQEDIDDHSLLDKY